MHHHGYDYTRVSVKQVVHEHLVGEPMTKLPPVWPARDGYGRSGNCMTRRGARRGVEPIVALHRETAALLAELTRSDHQRMGA